MCPSFVTIRPKKEQATIHVAFGFRHARFRWKMQVAAPTANRVADDGSGIFEASNAGGNPQLLGSRLSLCGFRRVSLVAFQLAIVCLYITLPACQIVRKN
jgi:hypothetical protein